MCELTLGKRIEGARAAQIRDRMADVDAARLPTVEEARALYKARENDRENDRRQVEQPKPAAAPEITILKVAPPPNPQLGRPLELSQNMPPRPSAEDRQPEIRVIAEPIPEAPPPPPKRDEIEQRPAPAMFRQLYTAAAEITHRVLGKARQLFERPSDIPKTEPPPSAIQPQQSPEVIRIPKPPHMADPEPPRKKADPPRPTFDELRDQLERPRPDLEGPER